MRADLDQPWSFTHRAKKAFTLISPVDINTPEQLVSQTHIVRNLYAIFYFTGTNEKGW